MKWFRIPRKKKDLGICRIYGGGGVAATISLLALFAWAGGTDGAGGRAGGGSAGGSVVKCEIEPKIVPKIINGKIELTIFFDEKRAKEIALSHGRKYQLTELWEAENGYGPFQRRKLEMMFDDKTPVNFTFNLLGGR